MEVIDHEPHAWFLLRDGQQFFLDVNCTFPMFDTSVLVHFDEQEVREYVALGRTFIEYFAAKIAYWATTYQARVVTGPDALVVEAAITEWLRLHPMS